MYVEKTRNSVGWFLVFAALVLLSIFCGLSGFAQDAKVVALTPAETQEAIELRQERAALDKKDKDFKDSIIKAHLVTHQHTSSSVRYSFSTDNNLNGVSAFGGLTITGSGGSDTVCYATTPSGNNYWYPCHASAADIQTKSTEADFYAKVEQDREAKALYYKSGWDNGFKFSEDFKYIVPEEVKLKDNNATFGCIQPAYTQVR